MADKSESLDSAAKSGPADWLDVHGDALFAFALIRVCQRDLAEDLVQETLLSAIKGWDRFDGKSAVRTWLIGILKRKIIDNFRRQQVREKGQQEIRRQATGDSNPSGTAPLFKKNGSWVEGVARWGNDPSQVVESREFWEEFQKCRSKLPQLLQSVFVLCEIEQQTKEETCKQLGISPSNLSVRLFRARMSLRQCLESNWFKRK